LAAPIVTSNSIISPACRSSRRPLQPGRLVFIFRPRRSPGGLFSGRFLNKPGDGFTMQDDDSKPEGPGDAFAKDSDKAAKQGQRKDRLKLALRENLKRRKSQARGRGDLATPSDIEDVSPYDDGDR
jgi:hypothetical protein